MREVDSVAFGNRVRERREELKLSQKRLGKESSHSQQNINWIEGGGPKRPHRYAAELAGALRTSQEWLLWGEGRRAVRPRYLTGREFAEKYETLPAERKEFYSQAIENEGPRARKSG